MERALLEGEEQIQLEQLETAKEKVASLEAKESRLLAEAAAERAKVSADFFIAVIFRNLQCIIFRIYCTACQLLGCVMVIS